jgi:hypothetical protein
MTPLSDAGTAPLNRLMERKTRTDLVAHDEQGATYLAVGHADHWGWWII